MLSLRDLRFVLRSRDLDVLRTQRIIGLLSYYPQINEVRLITWSRHANYNVTKSAK